MDSTRCRPSGRRPTNSAIRRPAAALPNVATQTIPQAAAGSVNYAQPVATVGVPISVQGIGINPETQQAVLFDPTSSGVVSFFSLIDQSVSSLSLVK